MTEPNLTNKKVDFLVFFYDLLVDQLAFGITSRPSLRYCYFYFYFILF
jgi:hypothetical protein